MVYNWIVQVIVAIVLAIVSYALTPQPDGQPSSATKELEAPTAESGRPIIVVFGTVLVKSLNTLYSTDKRTRNYEVSSGGGK